MNYPPYIILPREQFSAGFFDSTGNELCKEDQDETLRQIFDVLLNGGRSAALAIDFQSFPDLNRMHNTNWRVDGAFCSAWRNNTRSMVLNLIAHLDNLLVFSPTGEFDYILNVNQPDMVVLQYLSS